MTMLHSRTEATSPATADTDNTVPTTFARRALAVLRIAFGLTFLWAFFDKLLALGFSTGRSVNPETGVETVDRFGDAAWISGGNPTEGFLKFGADGPFKGFYNSIAGDAWVNVSFMFALLALGVALTFGIGMRIAAIGGAVLYLMMWSVALLPENNPIIDDHILGAITLVVLAAFAAGDTWGLGHWWKRESLGRDHPVLR
jgi:thiosulfate dehydrogenase [quinone] large subunit